MSEQNRDERLQKELEGLRELKRQSSLFSFEHEGDPPEKYVVTFEGRGISGIDSGSGEAEYLESHQIQIQMAYLYPEREPDLKWLTPIYHPNVSNSGFVDLEDVGLTWTQELTVEIICERLWDVIRLAHLDLEKSNQMAAKEWFKSKLNLKLPIDGRPLRDRAVATQSNVVQYSRRNEKSRKLEPLVKSDQEVLFIGAEDRAANVRERPPANTHVARPPATQRPVPPPPVSRPGSGDDDILFID